MTLPASRALRPSSIGALLVHGHDEIAAFDREIDALAIRVGAPVTGRWAWMWPTIAAAGARSTAILVADGDGLAAAAVLVHDIVDGRVEFTLAGGGDGHRAPFLTNGPRASLALADAVLAEVSRADGPTRLRIGPMSVFDLTMRRLNALVPGEVCATTELIPAVRRHGSVEVDDYLSDGMRRTLRKSRNRLRTDGRTVLVRHTRDRDEVMRQLPDVAAVSRRRDHAGGRTSPLDDDAGLRRWEQRISAVAALCDVELSTLFIDDEPAAYVLAVEDGRDYRVLEGRFVMEWARYSPGRLLEADVLGRVLRDAHLDQLDWMTSVAPDRLLCANDGHAVASLDALF